MGIYLTKPNKVKETEEGEIAEFRFAASSMQGWRTGMEDAHICATNVKENVHLFAVFDGHGGPEVARFCGRRFVEELQKNESFKQGAYGEALKENFLHMDELLRSAEGIEELKTLRKDGESNMQSYAGCTANVCLVTPSEVICANAGDSRALLYGTAGVQALSTDHKPDMPREKARISAAGGYVSEGRVNDNLNLSRAIGDLEYKRNPSMKPEQQIISAMPDIEVIPRSKAHRFLLMGCDGIWETKTTQDICEWITTRITAEEAKPLPLGPVVEDLLDLLIATDTAEAVGCDNMTCVCVVFK